LFKTRKKLLAYTLLLILAFSSGCYIGVVYSNGSDPTWDEVLGIFNVPWFNASTGIDTPQYYRSGQNYTAWVESISGVSDHGDLTGLSDDDHPLYQTEELTSSGLADHAYSGSTVTGTAGEALAIGNTVYLDSDGKYYKTDANSSTTMFCVGISTETISQDSTGNILVEGYLRDDTWSGWTIGSEYPLYVSWNAGEITQTLPNTSGDQVQIIGYPIASKIIRFDPDSTVVEIS